MQPVPEDILSVMACKCKTTTRKYCQGSKETRMMGLPEGRKHFKIAVLIQHRRVSDIQPASQPRRRSIYRAYYVAQVKMASSA